MISLVTGATGFIGRRLMVGGHLAFVRQPAGFLRERVGDLMDLPSLLSACAGVDTVIHCAGYAHALPVGNPETHWKVNYLGTKNLLDAAGRNGVRRLVFLSSVKAMAEPGDQCADESWPGEPASSYGRAKRAAEDLVIEAGEKYGMHVVNLRLAMVYGRGGKGNLERLAKALRAGWFPRLPDTANRRSLVHVEDVVSAIQMAAELPEANGRTYIVADPRPYSGRELCEAILAISAGTGFSWDSPAWFLRWGGKAGDVAGKILRRSLPLNSEVVSRLLDSECYSPALIERELGWRSRISLVDGLREMLNPRVENK